MIEISTPYSFSEIGRKSNQEDSLFPASADSATRVFILCDGMGGHKRGEVASGIVSESLGNKLSQEKTEGVRIGRSQFDDALDYAYRQLDTIDGNESAKPGTTMTCLCINDKDCLAAHMGDSRIYQIRPSDFNPLNPENSIKFRTRDHSLVNDLLRAGEITEEEARNFPQKNVIMRAMQPGEDNRRNADISILEDVRDGDYFFMCCDGILEQLSEKQLCEIVCNTILSDANKIEAIKNVCLGKTHDNFSCWLIPVSVKADLEVQEIRPETQSMECYYESELPEEDDNRSFKVWIIAAAIFIISFILGLIWFAPIVKTKKTEKERKETKIKKKLTHITKIQVDVACHV